MLHIVLGIYLFYGVGEIQSNKPFNYQAESPAPTEEIQKQLDQSFTYLGSGKVSHAFLGEDQKTVLKFFKHQKGIDLDGTFKSCQIALEKLKDETGVLYVHLQKTQGLHGKVRLKDSLGIPHSIDLDATEFVVQKKAELVLHELERQIKTGNIEKAKLSICAIFDCIKAYSDKGITIPHSALRRNFGFIDDKVVSFDIGSFIEGNADYRNELITVTHRLNRWLKKHHPILLQFYHEELNRRLQLETE